MTITGQPRRWELDWLRVLAVAVVFLYHAARYLAEPYWELQNVRRAFWVDLSAGFVALVLIPLLFLVAGAAARFSLERHSPRRYLWLRFQRLILPFVAGVLLLIPAQAYLEARRAGWVEGSYLEFCSGFFAERFEAPHWSLRWVFADFGYHLWFLGYLFLFSLLALPFFQVLRSGRLGQRLIAALSRYSVLSWAIPIALVQAGLRARFPWYLGPADFWSWFLVFLYGYLLYADSRITCGVLRQWKTALVTGLLCLAALAAALQAGYVESWQRSPGYSPGFLLFQVLCSLDAWAWLVCVVCLGGRYLNAGRPVVRHLNGLVLPFYILHPLAISAIGLLVVPWTVSVLVKYLGLVAVAAAVTLAVCEVAWQLLVRIRGRRLL